MTSPRSRQTTSVDTDRMVWMDGLRGIAILLIILLHSVANIESAGLPVTAALDHFNHFMDPWRLPTLMMLSGMLLAGSLRKSPGTYVLGKVRGILWPYIVWNLIIVAAFPWFGLSDFVTALWAPDTYLWYLHTLFICYLIALALRRVNPLAVAGGAYLMALIFWSFTLPPWLEQVNPVRFALMLMYFMVGHWIMVNRDKVFDAIEPIWRVLTLLACGILVGLLDFLPEVYTNSVPAYSIPLVGGIVGGIALARRLRWRGAVARFVRFVGENSIVFYLSHWLLISLPLGYIAALPDWHGIWYLVSAFACALCGGLILAYLQKRILPVRWLFRV